MNENNLNPMVNGIGLAQGVDLRTIHPAGLDPYASQTGGLSPSGKDGHGAYGWNHSMLFGRDPEYAKKAVVSLLLRGEFYANEDRRQSGYWNAGRPVGWQPEEANDIGGSGWKRGGKLYHTAHGKFEFSAADPQHRWADPCWDLLLLRDETPIKVFDDELPAHRVVRWALRRQAESVAGQMRKDGQWMAGGRASALALNWFNQAHRTKLFQVKDEKWPARQEVLDAYLDWLTDWALPQLEKGKGVREIGSTGVCRWVQECGWMLPAVYEAAQFTFANHEFGPRFHAIGKRIARWMLDIDAIAGGRAKWYNLRITTAIRNGSGGKPLESLVGAITAADVMDVHEDDYTLWSLRAADVARHYHPSDFASEFYDRVRSKAEKNAGGYLGHDDVWLVDKNRNPLKPTA